MAKRLVPEHFNPRGEPKRAFSSVEEASAFRRSHKGLGQKRIYQCEMCGAWHLGKRSGQAA